MQKYARVLSVQLDWRSSITLEGTSERCIGNEGIQEGAI